jgi:flagellar hook-basal body complex protein FliE
MNEINTDYLLSQIRTLNAELQAPMTAPTDRPLAGPEFGSVLKNTLDTVNATQSTAAELKAAFETGQTDKTLAEVMIASQKADLSFRAMAEVRNKLITAYQDIMNMPV